MNLEELKRIDNLNDEIEELKKVITKYKQDISNLQEKNKDLELETEDLTYQVSEYQKILKQKTDAYNTVVRSLEEANRRITHANSVIKAYNRMTAIISDHSSLTQQRFRVEMSDFKEFYNRLIEASKVIDED
jgi:chromosome segregation ATPase